jgi:large subunit ribosomal protein L19
LLDDTNAARRHDATMGADLQIGDEVEVQERDGDAVVSYRGIVISRKGGSAQRTITLRRVSDGYAGERVVPLHAPATLVVRRVRPHRMRRSKLRYLRQRDEMATGLRRRHAGRLARMAEEIQQLLNLIRRRMAQE